MILKTFRAQSMADALSLVKKDLGKDAVILSTRSLKVGGFLGLGGRSVIEITASNQGPMFQRRAESAKAAEPALRQQVRVPERPMSGGGGGDGRSVAASIALNAYRQLDPTRPASSSSPLPPAFIPAPEPKPDPLAGMSFSRTPRDDQTDQLSLAVPRLASDQARSADPFVMQVRSSRQAASSISTPEAASASLIHRELNDIKLLVNQVLQCSPAVGAGPSGSCSVGMPEALFKHYLKLLEAQVAREFADTVVGAVRDELTPGELSDESIVRASVLRHLAGLLPTDETVARPTRPASQSTDSGRPFLMALVGPTGVGKTTTVAKLAASFKLRHGRSVALITSDTYRIAAVDQLRTYASIIGLPLKVVMTPDEMRTAIDDLREAGHDLILIDTAGRSQNNTDRLAELAAFLDAARPDQTHLVLSSAASEAVLVRTAQAFASTRPNHILFTKLDEAVNFGVLVNVVQRVARELRLSQIDPRSAAQGGGGIPLSFVTTGQEVPDHIEPGRADRLARAVLDNRLTADERRPVDPPVHA